MKHNNFEQHIEDNQERQLAISRGFEFLTSKEQSGSFECYSSSDREMTDNLIKAPREIASSLLVLGTALKNESTSKIIADLTHYCKSQLSSGKFYFFENHSLLPADAETTSYGLSVLLEMGVIDKKMAESTADEIIKNVNKDGLINIYFNPKEYGKANTIDHVSIANILYFLNVINKGDEARASEDYIFDVLKNEEYLKGSHYYHSPDAFLYFISRLTKFPKLADKFSALLLEQLKKHIGKTEYPLDISMRVKIAKELEITNDREEEKIINYQKIDGSWPMDSIYHYGGKIGYFGSESISTAFAIEALK